MNTDYLIEVWKYMLPTPTKRNKSTVADVDGTELEIITVSTEI